MKKLLAIALILSACGSNNSKPAVETPKNPIIGITKRLGNIEIAEKYFPDTMNLDAAMAACAKLGTGWRLPTKEELNEMYLNKDKIGGFSIDFYWSSSKDAYRGTWVQRFDNGDQYPSEVYNMLRVRAVRAFNNSNSGGSTTEQTVSNADDNKTSSELAGIKIGAQIWMVKNLDVDHYRNGDTIPQVQDAAQWKNLTTGAWYYYDNDPANGTTYGKLYNWYAVNDPRGLAPKGWHVPRDAELTILTDYLGGEDGAGTQMKSTSGWISNGNGSNSSGFACLPGGSRNDDGTFNFVGAAGCLWSSSESNSNKAWCRFLYSTNGNVGRFDGNRRFGFSVRCLKD